MTTDQLFEILQEVWARETSVDQAWEWIEQDRESPTGDSKEYWLPLQSTEDRW